MKNGIGTSCSGRIKRAPSLPKHGLYVGVKGWRATKDEAKERKAFKRLSREDAAKIEEQKLAELRETMESILE
jgi:hypothetical protein